MKAAEILRLLQQDGWLLVAQKGKATASSSTGEVGKSDGARQAER
jgi:hypothetical protein